MGETEGGNEWSTPQHIYDELCMEFNFKLDAFASTENYKHECYFTKKDDAFAQDWWKTTGGGAVFCNPPYGRSPGLLNCVQKGYFEAMRGCTVVMLIPADTSTQYFEFAMQRALELRFMTPRVRFGGATGSPKFGSLVVVFGQRKNLWQPTPIVRLWRHG